jgi:hypothetical protein
MWVVVQCLALACLLLPGVAQAKWFEARSANFIVYSDGNEDKLRRSVQQLENYDRLLRTLTGTTAPPSASPLEVYLVSSNDKLRQIETVPPIVLGLYRARVGGTAAFAVRGDRPAVGGEEVLFHEYAHHFATRYYPAYYPAWYSEGFAEYVMTARFAPDRVEIGPYNPGRAITLLRGTWLPLNRIFSNQLGALSHEQAGHYLFAEPERREALTRYFAQLHRSVPEPEAFRTAFGTDHKGAVSLTRTALHTMHVSL